MSVVGVCGLKGWMRDAMRLKARRRLATRFLLAECRAQALALVRGLVSDAAQCAGHSRGAGGCKSRGRSSRIPRVCRRSQPAKTRGGGHRRSGFRPMAARRDRTASGRRSLRGLPHPGPRCDRRCTASRGASAPPSCKGVGGSNHWVAKAGDRGNAQIFARAGYGRGRGYRCGDGGRVWLDVRSATASVRDSVRRACRPGANALRARPRKFIARKFPRQPPSRRGER